MVRSFYFIRGIAAALWKDIRFTSRNGIYATLSEGENNNHNNSKKIHKEQQARFRGAIIPWGWLASEHMFSHGFVTGRVTPFGPVRVGVACQRDPKRPVRDLKTSWLDPFRDSRVSELFFHLASPDPTQPARFLEISPDLFFGQLLH